MSLHKTSMIMAILILVVGIYSNWPSAGIVSVSALTEINFTAGSIDWGAGRVSSGVTSATLDSDAGTVTGGTWTSTSGEIILENIGTDNVTLDIYSDKDADGLVGGTSPSFQWLVQEVEASSCTGTNNVTGMTYTDVNITNPGTRICDIFDNATTSNSVKIDFKIVIPSDTTKAGAQSATITATATGI